MRLSLLFTFSLGATSGFGGSVNAASLLEFVDSGHDLIMAADASASELIREIAVECGVDFDEVTFFFFVWVLVCVCPCVWFALSRMPFSFSFSFILGDLKWMQHLFICHLSK